MQMAIGEITDCHRQTKLFILLNYYLSSANPSIGVRPVSLFQTNALIAFIEAVPTLIVA